MSLTRRSVVAVIGTILAFAMGPEPAGAEGHSAPADFLRSLTESAAEKLGDANVGQDEKEAAFRGLFREAFDVPGISRFVLGKHWTRAGPDQREAFMASFEEMHMRRFLPLFAEFSKDMISIGRFKEEKNNPGYYLVGSTIQRPNETPIAVIWRLRDNDGDFVVMDVIAEGVSMAISLRHEYGEVVQNHGIDGLIARLKEKNARLSAE
jgi:phospholipid transport system substrate-binding protein